MADFYGGAGGSGCVPLNQTIASHTSDSPTAQLKPASGLSRASLAQFVPGSGTSVLAIF